MLTLALPSKGRLKEEAEAFFARIGAPVKTASSRDYVGHLGGVPQVTVLFLQASEITRRLMEGTVDIGITGIDLLEEYRGSQPPAVHPLKKLSFGYASLVVAVPRSWLDVETMADLDEVAHDLRQKYGRRMRVATKYFNLTNGFFASHGISDYRLVESAGATEAAPNIGTAEIITDITTTGSTLEANHLKILSDGVILKSEALLAVRLKGTWTSDQKQSLQQLTDLIHAQGQAKEISILRGSCQNPLPTLEAILAEKGGRDIVVAAGGFSCNLPTPQIYETVRLLQEVGAHTMTVTKPEQVFVSHNPLWQALEGSLQKSDL